MGTHFTVNAFDKNKEVTVIVQSGQVSVYRHNKTEKIVSDHQEIEGVLLLPNQQVVFERETEQFKKTLIANPIIVEIGEQKKSN